MRFLLIFLFTIVAVATAVEPDEQSNAAQESCEPGKSLMRYCNHCVCGDDGKLGSCTRMYCDKRIWNVDGTRKELSNALWLDDEWQDRPDYEKEQSPGDEREEQDEGGRLPDDEWQDHTDEEKEAGPSDEKEERPDDDDESEEHRLEKRQVCVPGTSYRNYCNTCTCNDSGTGHTCTIKRCGNGEFEKNGQRPYVHYDINFLKKALESRTQDLSLPSFEMRCEPDKSFKYYCNTCECGADGVPSKCTLKYCAPGLWSRDGSLMTSIAEGSDLAGAEARVNEDLYFANIGCEPGKNFMHYCNRCRCFTTGIGASCSFMACPPGLHNRDGSLRITNENNTISASMQPTSLSSSRKKREIDDVDFLTLRCEAGQTFFHYCNLCTCSLTGIGAGCTYKACKPGLYNRDGTFKQVTVTAGDMTFADTRCEAGKSFYFYCNRCQCSPTGVGANCTNKACPFGVYDHDGSLKATTAGEINQIDPNFRCEAGKSFKRYCNTCWCSLTGVGASCTNRPCVPGHDNLDGTVNVVTREENDNDFANMRCSPNENFRHYCKYCHCSQTGIGASCSQDVCPLGVYYRDGTLKVRRDPQYYGYDLD